MKKENSSFPLFIVDKYFPKYQVSLSRGDGKKYNEKLLWKYCSRFGKAFNSIQFISMEILLLFLRFFTFSQQ